MAQLITQIENIYISVTPPRIKLGITGQHYASQYLFSHTNIIPLTNK